MGFLGHSCNLNAIQHVVIDNFTRNSALGDVHLIQSIVKAVDQIFGAGCIFKRRGAGKVGVDVNDRAHDLGKLDEKLGSQEKIYVVETGLPGFVY